MKLEMICTGEEVLAGQIVDTNAAWLGNQLMENGFEMHRRTTVGDRLADLVEVFQERSQYADIILVNGGLGPTADDLSAKAMADAMGVELVENKQWTARLEEWAKDRNVTLNPNNLKQALLRVIKNYHKYSISYLGKILKKLNRSQIICNYIVYMVIFLSQSKTKNFKSQRHSNNIEKSAIQTSQRHDVYNTHYIK